jgi:tetratricopeptide (TPR) repeat protein
MTGRHLTVKELIITHLAPLSRYADEYECPEGMAQAGIAMAIGKSRAHTTIELNRMKGDSLVNERLAHVKGARSKRKTYTLTAEALGMERKITGHIERMDIEFLGSEDFGQTKGLQAVDIIVRELSTSRAMALDLILFSNGTIDLDEEKTHQPKTSFEEKTESDPIDQPDDLSQEGNTLDSRILQANTISKKGHSNEALEVLEKALQDFPSDPDISRVYYSRASIFRKQGNYPQALDDINKSLKMAQDSPHSLMVGRCQMEKAMILSGKGNETKSMELLDSADEIFRQKNSQVDILRCGINQSIILRNLGKVEEAIDVLDISLDIAEKTGLDRLRAYAMANLTDLLNDQKDFEYSIELGQKASDIFRVLDEPIMLAASLFNLGTAQAGMGKKMEAIKSLDNAIAILEKNEMLASRTEWLEKYASILEKMGEPEKAKSILQKI